MTQTKPIKAPAAIRHRHCDWLPGQVHLFEMPSSRRDAKHVQEIDLESGHVRCSCEHFRFRFAMHEPTLGVPEMHCKHLSAAIEWLLDNSFLDAEDLRVAELLHELQPCVECGNASAELLLCDEQGRALEGFLCQECFRAARALNEDWSDTAYNLQLEIATLDQRVAELRAADARWPAELQSHGRELSEIHTRLMSLWRAFMDCEAEETTR